jgi:hypothetical protein
MTVAADSNRFPLLSPFATNEHSHPLIFLQPRAQRSHGYIIQKGLDKSKPFLHVFKNNATFFR